MRRILRTFVIAAVAATPAWAGLEFTVVSKTEGGPGASMGDMVMNAQTEGDQARIEFTETHNPMFGSGSYMLVNAKGEMTIVNPEKRTYSRLDLAAMMEGAEAGLGAAAKMGIKMEVEDPKVEKVLEEPGGDILGYPTTHYRWHTSYTMVVRLPKPIPDRRSPSESTEDIWTTTAISMPAHAGKALEGMGGGQVMGELKKVSDLAMAKMTGFHLKSITVTPARGGRGGSTKTTMEVTKIHKADIPASTFVIPAGYTETDLMQQQQRGPAMPDLNKE
ncbi:MAG TPA: DUF4412 domain-containing protein [Thermoanaerobaculaceae bacterium]|nr:DUF4412 domain-containing protein [Thermoanaerobaculaceae bacterium]